MGIEKIYYEMIGEEMEINPCDGCYDYENDKCISDGGCGKNNLYMKKQ